MGGDLTTLERELLANLAATASRRQLARLCRDRLLSPSTVEQAVDAARVKLTG